MVRANLRDCAASLEGGPTVRGRNAEELTESTIEMRIAFESSTRATAVSDLLFCSSG